MHPQRTAILIASTAGIIGVFLPWMTFFNISIAGVKTDDGKITLFFLLIPFLFALFKTRSAPISKPAFVIIIISACLAFAPPCYHIINNPIITFGIYFCAFASVAIIFTAFLFKNHPAPAVENQSNHPQFHTPPIQQRPENHHQPTPANYPSPNYSQPKPSHPTPPPNYSTPVQDIPLYPPQPTSPKRNILNCIPLSTTSPYKFACPHCRQHYALQIIETHQSSMKCRRCGGSFHVAASMFDIVR